MGRPRLYTTSLERKAAWRRRQGMAVRPRYPSSAKQVAYRARKRQAAQDLAARECAAIQQALRTRALADQSWELHELIDACSRDQDMPRGVLANHPPQLLAGASAYFDGMAAARVRRHRRARPHAGGCASPLPHERWQETVKRTWRVHDGPRDACPPAHKKRCVTATVCYAHPE